MTKSWSKHDYVQGFDCDSVQDSYEEQEFWMTRLDWVGIRLNQFEMCEAHETVYQYENNVVLVENSVEWKPCINRECKGLKLTTYL